LREEWNIAFGTYYTLLTCILFSFFSCSAPRYDGSTLAGKTAILDAVSLALSKEDCSTAITQIEGLYNSIYTDNKVRLSRASAYACRAGLSNFFQFLGNLADQTNYPLAPVPAEGAFFWRSMAKLFYLETTNDSGATVIDTNALNVRLQASWNATDALLASLVIPATAIPLTSRVNTETFNVGSLNPNDRTNDSNLYLIFVSMASIGILEDLYGYVATTPPDKTTFKKLQKLAAATFPANGWETAANVDIYGCSYASSILNLKDSISSVSENLPAGSLKTALTTINDIFSGFDTACSAACTVCGFSCAECPRFLRSRDSCTLDITTTNDDIARCAAAGLVSLINSSAVVGWVGP
jgi:hypothetical protein